MDRYKVDLLMISEKKKSILHFQAPNFLWNLIQNDTNSKGRVTILYDREDAPFNLIKHHLMTMTTNISYMNLILG